MAQSRKRSANGNDSAKPVAKGPGGSSTAATPASRESGAKAEGRKKRALDVNAGAPTQAAVNQKPPAQAATGNGPASGGGPKISASPPVFDEVKLPGLSPSAADRGKSKETAKTARPPSADEVGRHPSQVCTGCKPATRSCFQSPRPDSCASLVGGDVVKIP